MQHNKHNWLLWLLPTPGNIIITLLIVGAIHWSQNVDATTLIGDSPPTASSTIPSQGYLTDADGNPLSGPQAMTFSLYTEPRGGKALWSEGRVGTNSVAITNGEYNILLGSLEPLDQRIISENSTLYLGVTVGVYEEMRPRVQLGRVPYAVQALTVPDGSITRAKLAPDVLENQQDDLVESVAVPFVPTAPSAPSVPFVSAAPSIPSVESHAVSTAPFVSTAPSVPSAPSVSSMESHFVTAPEALWDVPDCTLGGHGEDDTWTAIPGLSIDLTLNVSTTVWLDFAALGMNRGGGQAIYSNIFVDGVRTKLASGSSDLSGCRNGPQGDVGGLWCTLSNLAGPLLGPGDHTIEARAWCDGSDGASVYGGTLRALILP